MHIISNRTNNTLSIRGNISSGAINEIRASYSDGEAIVGTYILLLSYNSKTIAMAEATASNGALYFELNTNTVSAQSVLTTVGGVEELPVKISILHSTVPPKLIGTGYVTMVVNYSDELPAAEAI